MPNSPPPPPPPPPPSATHRRLCDFCNRSTALLYCRADAAKLCLSCDGEVHSTNPLFTKHARVLLCDGCDAAAASIFCSTDSSVLCQNCDWESHTRGGGGGGGGCGPQQHDRRPLEGFSGRPTVGELLGIFGFEDLSKKGLIDGGESDDGFSDLFVWETGNVFSLDDLIVSSGDGCSNYPVMGVPPLPKNRNAACGLHKEELLHQLRELAKLEPNLDDGEGIIEPCDEYKSILADKSIPLQDMCEGNELKPGPTLYSSYEASSFQWCCDTGEFTVQEYPSNFIEQNCLVPEKDSEVGHGPSHLDCGHDGNFQPPVVSESIQVIPTVAARELNSQERDTALSRYKEKKKSRRYDKRIRYESRKVRAESRTRIRGRFAKMER